MIIIHGKLRWRDRGVRVARWRYVSVAAVEEKLTVWIEDGRDV